ncbi:MAG: hypothetical protein R3B70_47520 [Polyangiaceae bacterium]
MRHTSTLTTMALLLAGLLAAAAIGCDEGKSTSNNEGGSGGEGGGNTTGEGAGNTGTNTETGTGTETSTTPGNTSMIDDMEDGDGSILNVEGRLGAWYTYNDESPTGTQTPPVGDAFEMSPLNPPRGTSAFGAHTSGSGFDTWGSGFGFDFNNNGTTKMGYDASKFTGITFWAKIADGTTGVIRVNIGDKNTAPEGGVCDDAGGKCNDDFGAGISVTAEWKQYTLKFSELAQVGWSMVLLPSVEKSALYSVHFQTGAMSKFDIWIIDIVFTE